ncbi:MAG: TlpA family protein disulfide reductase [Alphaproteobacteria bacterium]|nr:TlpA family protein disulfide reductase [Alphaproteobacteria bacterium]
MKPKIMIVFLLVILGLALEIWSESTPPATSSTEQIKTEQIKAINTPAPAFSFPTLGGTTKTLQDYQGKTILLNFWATWCAACMAEFPGLLELASRYPDNIVLLALSVDENPENIEPFIRRFDEEFQKKAKAPNVIIGLDPEKKIAQDLFGTVLFPETYIIGPDMTIRRKIVGAIEWSGQNLENLLNLPSEGPKSGP